MSTKKLARKEEEMLLNVREVAEMLGVSERSVWRWSATGILPPGIKIGGCVRWPEETIRRWIRKREREALAKQKAGAARRGS